VVDDGSIDDTPSVVEALAQAHSKPRLSLLRQPAKEPERGTERFRRTAQRVRDAARGRQTPIVRQRRVWRASLAICPRLSVL
jgi:hypothetical protein